MEICSTEYLAVVGLVSAIVHILVRSLIHMYPSQNMLLLNLMLLVNVLLLVYFGSCVYKNNKKSD